MARLDAIVVNVTFFLGFPGGGGGAGASCNNRQVSQIRFFATELCRISPPQFSQKCFCDVSLKRRTAKVGIKHACISFLPCAKRWFRCSACIGSAVSPLSFARHARLGLSLALTAQPARKDVVTWSCPVRRSQVASLVAPDRRAFEVSVFDLWKLAHTCSGSSRRHV